MVTIRSHFVTDSELCHPGDFELDEGIAEFLWWGINLTGLVQVPVVGGCKTAGSVNARNFFTILSASTEKLTTLL